ncbi:MAG TPA: hypothetical protein VH415_01820 [Nitrososphaeraceae archaeon]|jgi:hypothetical protein
MSISELRNFRELRKPIIASLGIAEAIARQAIPSLVNTPDID